MQFSRDDLTLMSSGQDGIYNWEINSGNAQVIKTTEGKHHSYQNQYQYKDNTLNSNFDRDKTLNLYERELDGQISS